MLATARRSARSAPICWSGVAGQGHRRPRAGTWPGPTWRPQASPGRRHRRGVVVTGPGFQTSAQAHRLLTDKLATAGSRGYHYRLLAALQEFGPASQAALGRRTGMDRSDVVAALNELAGQGLVERTRDPADHRRNIVTITPAGLRALRGA